MLQFGGKDSKRHFTVIMGGKEHGLYVSSTPSSAAKKAVTKLCASNKSKKVEFHIREITHGSKKKTYGPYEGHIEKLKMPIELKGRVIKYKPVAKLSGKSGAKKGGGPLEDFKKNYNICIQKAKDKLEEMITNDEFVNLYLENIGSFVHGASCPFSRVNRITSLSQIKYNSPSVERTVSAVGCGYGQ